MCLVFDLNLVKGLLMSTFTRTLCFLILLPSCELREDVCATNLLQCEMVNNSPILQYSTDVRLMKGVKKLGILDNGMVVHTWFWNDEAKKLGPKYNDPQFGGVIDNISLSAVGLLTSEVKKMYPEAVVINRDGFEQINEKELIENDEFIKNLITAKKVDGASSCTIVDGTRFRFCF